MTSLADLTDGALELAIVPSFTRVGPDVRRRTERWSALDAYDLRGRVMVVTGATSGLGKAAAEQLARCGATLVVTGRNGARNDRVVEDLVERTGNAAISHVAGDMGEHADVRAIADAVLERHDRIDAVIHNAGALSNDRAVTSSGIEATVATQLVGPFLLTTLLLDRLRASAPARVITMSSGGMYSAGLTVSKLEMSATDYRGAEQYARAKRAQIAMTRVWAERFGASGVVFHALHPGWAATPGVDEALPRFARLMGPLLRTPEQGADTMVWLAADDDALGSNGAFWLDRRPRSTHRLRSTKRTDTAERRAELWDHISKLAGVSPER